MDKHTWMADHIWKCRDLGYSVIILFMKNIAKIRLPKEFSARTMSNGKLKITDFLLYTKIILSIYLCNMMSEIFEILMNDVWSNSHRLKYKRLQRYIHRVTHQGWDCLRQLERYDEWLNYLAKKSTSLQLRGIMNHEETDWFSCSHL